MEEQKTRIYGKKEEISEEKVRAFYNKRGEDDFVKANGWTAISLGAENPDIAKRVFAYDRDVLLPKMQLHENSKVLELGCGMGRWAKIILPHCKSYYGVDISENMLKQAEYICAEYKGKYHFLHMSATDVACQPEEFFNGKFDSVVLSGICMYINDDKLSSLFSVLPRLCNDHCVIFLRETTAFKERLTLKDFPSEALKTEYNAIYRTAEEYNQLFGPLYKAGFSLKEQEFLPENLGRVRTETNGMFYVLIR